MEIVQKSFTLCFILSSIFFSVSLAAVQRTYRNNSNIFNMYRKGNAVTNDETTCLCSPDTQTVTIRDQLDAEDDGIERVVVYFYKNKLTAEYNMYIPNVKRQYLIPDLKLEPGDKLVLVSDKKLANILDSNPNVILRERTVTNSASNPSEPIGMNQGTIQVATNYINQEKQQTTFDTIEQPIISFSIPKKGNSPVSLAQRNGSELFNAALTEVFSKPDLIQENIIGSLEKDYVTPEIIKQNSIKKKESLTAPNKEVNNPKELNLDFNSQNDRYQLFDVLSALKSITSGANNAVSNPNSDAYVTFDKWFSQQMNRVEMEGSVNSNAIDLGTLKNLLIKTLIDNQMFVSADGVLTDSSGNILMMSNLKLRPILIGDSVGYDKIIKEQAGSNQFRVPANMPFLESILISLVYPPKILGIIPLGKVYLGKDPTKQQLDLYKLENNSKAVTSKDMQTQRRMSKSEKIPSAADRYEYKVLSDRLMGFLEKQRDISGEKVYRKSVENIEKVINKKEEKYKNQHLSVTVKPKANKFKPSEPQQRRLNKGYEDLDITNILKRVSNVPLSNEEVNRSAMHLVLGDTEKAPSKVELAEETESIKYVTPKEILPNNHLELSNILNNSRRDLPTAHLESLVSSLTNLLSDNDLIKMIKQKIDQKDLKDNVMQPDKKLNFRIIGGNPATSSGSPISNRGRSGFIV